MKFALGALCVLALVAVAHAGKSFINAPRMLDWGEVTYTTMEGLWMDPNTDDAWESFQYGIRRDNNNDGKLDGKWKMFGGLERNMTGEHTYSFVFTRDKIASPLKSGKNYGFRVRVLHTNTDGTKDKGKFANSLNRKTLIDPPAKLQGVTAVLTDTNSITFAWNAFGGGGRTDSVVVNYRRVGDEEFSAREVQTQNQDVFEWVLEELEACTAYEVKIKAKNLLFDSSFSFLPNVGTMCEDSTVFWGKSTGAAWGNNANWLPGNQPGAADRVEINRQLEGVAADDITVTMPSRVVTIESIWNYHNVEVGAGDTLTVTDFVELTDGGSVTISGGGVLNIGSFSLTTDGTWDIKGGSGSWRMAEATV